jgi:hypothetical protein
MTKTMKSVGINAVPVEDGRGSELHLPLPAINALHQKRAELVDQVNHHLSAAARLREVLGTLDGTLELFGPDDPRAPGAAASGSQYLRYGEMRRRCLDAMRDGAIIKAEEVVLSLMRDKCLDPTDHRALRSDLVKRALRALHTLYREGRVAKIGHGHHVRWRSLEVIPVPPATQTLAGAPVA